MHGANRTGRPFTGDHAGILLYRTLHEAGLASAPVSVSADDALALVNARIVNAVKCVPPQNRPLPAEIRSCNAYLAAEVRELSAVRVYLALGRAAHDALLMARAPERARYPFGPGRDHRPDGAQSLLDSSPCSPYNTSTARPTTQLSRA